VSWKVGVAVPDAQGYGTTTPLLSVLALDLVTSWGSLIGPNLLNAILALELLAPNLVHN
jgi:hypothetical protein